MQSVDEEGWTPLHDACYHNHIPCAHLLLQLGADLHILDNDGWSPYAYTLYRGYLPLSFMLAVFNESRTCAEDANTSATPRAHVASIYDLYDEVEEFDWNLLRKEKILPDDGLSPPLSSLSSSLSSSALSSSSASSAPRA